APRRARDRPRRRPSAARAPRRCGMRAGSSGLRRRRSTPRTPPARARRELRRASSRAWTRRVIAWADGQDRDAAALVETNAARHALPVTEGDRAVLALAAGAEDEIAAGVGGDDLDTRGQAA